MDFHELVRNRYSVRGFTDESIPFEVLDRVVETALLAPSAANRQPWRIHLIQGPRERTALAEAYPREWLLEAPAIAVFTGLSGENWVRNDGMDYLMCDVTILADHFILAAAAEGLATCWIAAFDPKLVSIALDLPFEEKPVIMTPVGYAKPGSTRPRKRKAVDEVVSRR